MEARRKDTVCDEVKHVRVLCNRKVPFKTPGLLLVPDRDGTPDHGTSSDYVNDQTTTRHELVLSDSPIIQLDGHNSSSLPTKLGTWPQQQQKKQSSKENRQRQL